MEDRMLSKRIDAFEDVVLEAQAERQDLYERARAVLDEQADALMDTSVDPDGVENARHSAHNPHRRPLSAAARRLVWAHEHLEKETQD